MKNIKTFNQFSENSINEEIFGISKAERLEKRKSALEAEYNKYVRAWASKIEEPTEEVKAKFFADAEKDGYEGRAGIKNDNIVYRPANSVRWGSSGLVAGTGEL